MLNAVERNPFIEFYQDHQQCNVDDKPGKSDTTSFSGAVSAPVMQFTNHQKEETTVLQTCHVLHAVHTGLMSSLVEQKADIIAYCAKGSKIGLKVPYFFEI